jgi:hypothetical protein
MMCKNNGLDRTRFAQIWLLGWLGLLTPSYGCRTAPQAAVDPGPSLPTQRIAIVGASVSAGFGGTPFVDAFRQATKPCPGVPRCTAAVESWANIMLFRDPVGETKLQLTKATQLGATTVVALDLLFWHVYNVRDIEPALAELDKLHATGAWILVGDVPLITTASELLLPKQAIPPQDVLDAANQRIATWAKRDRILLVPLGEWTAPLRAGGEIEIAPGEQVPAASLMAIDGLHANPLGTWYLLSRLDRFIEERLPGTAKDALVFVRPH